MLVVCDLCCKGLYRVCGRKKTAVVFKVEPFCICLHLSRFIYMLICDCFIIDFILLFVIYVVRVLFFVTAVYIDFVKSCGVFKRSHVLSLRFEPFLYFLF